MRTTVLFLTVLGCSLAVPNGYYHQEYNYKTSASAYKNNELQHKTDDQGYYRKDGDLEGRVRPRVDSNSEHSEYVNPNLQNSDYNTGVLGAANGDLSSYGHLRADVGAHGLRDHSEGMAHSDHIGGSGQAYSGYSTGSSYGSNYGTSSQSYGATSNLRSVTSRLQQELQSDLQNALQENRAYSQSSQLGISELERELRQNITNRLNAELASRYGQQSVRGGLSYTITGGRLQSTANYDNRELQDLRRQMEDTLLNQLKTQYRQSSSSQYEDYNSHHNVYYTTTIRPFHPTTYYRPATTVRPNYLEPYVQPGHTYTPHLNRESLTTIASRVQTQLDSRLNQLLEDVERRYFSSGASYSSTNFEVVLERLRNELRQNITALFNDEISRNYGTQISRDGNMYTVGQQGTSGQHNYAVGDFESLRLQMERNLIEKLNRDFERHRSRWSQQYSHSFSGGSNLHYVENTPRYDAYTTPRYTYSNPRYVYTTPRYEYDADVEPISTRPASSNIASLISPTGGNQYHVAGSRQSEYGISSASSSGASVSQLQRQLQQDLSRQLQSAISRGHYGAYSTSSGYNPQTYQVSLQQLTDELNRNLTRQLQEYSASGYYSSHGNFDQSQLASLRSQLQADLMRQLQQGLQESYSSSSSYSASSSSSSHNGNYRPVRGFDNYQIGQYRAGNVADLQGEDCLGDDPNAYHNHRIKRSYQPYRSQPIGLGNSGASSASRDYNYGYSGNFRRDGHLDAYRTHPQQVEELGQQVDDSDLTQQVEELGQQVDNSDLTQVAASDFDRIQLGSQDQQQAEIGQQVDDSDLTQQVEDSHFGKIQLGSHSQQQTDLGQQVDDSDLTQQVEDSDFGRGDIGSHSQLQTGLGQKVDNSDLAQQVEDSGLGKLQLHSHGQQQIELEQVDDSDLTQQVEDSGFGRLSSGSQVHPQNEIGQQVDTSDLTQQVDNSGFERVQLGNPNQQQIQIGHNHNSELTQQVEDFGFGKLHSGSQQGQQEDYSDFTQNIDTDQTQLGLSQNHRVHHGPQQDLTQQVEEHSDGTLQLGSQGQQHISQDQLKLNKLQVEIAKKLEEDLSKQLKEAIHTQQIDATSYRTSYEQLLNDLQSNLTKQFQQISSGPSRYGPSYSNPFSGNFNDQQIANLRESIQHDLKRQLQKGLRESYTYSSSWSNSNHRQFTHHQIVSQTYGNDLERQNFNQRQVHVAQQLKEDLSKQLKNAIKATYSSNSYYGVTESQVLYQNLIKELERNLTKQLQKIGASGESYSDSYTFNNQQLNLLREQLEKDLKLQLQQEVTRTSDNALVLGQQKIDQEVDLTQQVQDNTFGSQRKPGQKIIDADLTHQVEENDGLTQQVEGTSFGLGSQQQIGQEQLGDDLRQTEDSREYLTQQAVDNNSGKLQFGNSGFQSPESGDQQEIVRNPIGQGQTLSLGNQQLTQEQLDLNQQVDNTYYRPQQIPSTNLQIGNRPVTRKPIDSNSFLHRERDELLNTNQYPSGQSQINYSQRPNNLPTLNQVIEQQQQQFGTEDHEVHNTELPSLVEPLSVPDSDLTQQQEDIGQQSVDSGLTNGQAEADFTQQNSKINDEQILTSGQTILPTGQSSNQLNPPTGNQNINRQVPLGQTGGQSVGVTSQGQIITKPQTLTEAENESNLLIERLRAAQQSRDQSSSGSFNYVHYNRPVPHYQTVQNEGEERNIEPDLTAVQIPSVRPAQEGYSFNQPESFDVYLNRKQAHFARQLEQDLYKQLQDAVSEKYYTYSSSGLANSQIYQTSYKQLSEECQRNITKKIQEILNSGQHGSPGYSAYVSLTDQQREKLLKQLQADLTRQLQQSLEVSYVSQQQNSGHSFDSTGHSTRQSTFGSSSYGSGYGGNHRYPNSPNSGNYGLGGGQVHYGQEGEIEDNIETASESYPIQPQYETADVVHNVEPQVGSNYNTGVKGHGRRLPSPYNSRQQSPPVAVGIYQPEVAYEPSAAVQNHPYGSPQESPSAPPGGEGVAPVAPPPGEPSPPTEQVDNQEGLPWWKRFGNKVKQGAHSLKEKIVG